MNDMPGLHDTLGDSYSMVKRHWNLYCIIADFRKERGMHFKVDLSKNTITGTDIFIIDLRNHHLS